MFTVERKELKKDSVYRSIYEFLVENHKVPEYTKKELIEKKHIKDLCQEATHFGVLPLPGEKPIYLHYEVANWYKEPKGIVMKIDRIIFYDDFMEYETARMKDLHGATDKDIPNIN